MCYDDPRCLEYLEEYRSHTQISVLKAPDLDKSVPFFYNLYSNFLINQVSAGWIVFLDDDDMLTEEHSLLRVAQTIKSNDDFIFWKVKVGQSTVYPTDLQKPAFAQIASIGFCFHSEHSKVRSSKGGRVRWYAKQGADYSYVSEVLQFYPHFNRKLIPEVLAATQHRAPGLRGITDGAKLITVLRRFGVHQVHLSTALAHLLARFCLHHDLLPLTNHKAPAIFFGVYNERDVAKISGHQGVTLVIPGVPTYLDSLPPAAIVLSTCSEMQNELMEHGTTSCLVSLHEAFTGISAYADFGRLSSYHDYASDQAFGDTETTERMDTLFEGIDTLYVGLHTHVETNSGYTERSRAVVSHLPNNILALNPMWKSNQKYLTNRIITTDGNNTIHFTADYMARALKRYNIRTVVCASDSLNFLTFVTAYKDLLAQKNIHTVYEVRGIWYKTSEAKQLYNYHTHGITPAVSTARERLELEALHTCDKICFITDQVRDYFFRVSPDLVDKPNIVIYNAADPGESSPRDINYQTNNEVFTIGYAGSVAPYEGIDDLVEVLDGLHRDNIRVNLRLIGKLGILSTVIDKPYIKYTPWMEKSELEKELNSMDLYCLPRRPYEVCELVSPLKAYDALVRKIPLLMSDCDCLKDIAGNGTRCLLFRKGNLEDLRSKILGVLKRGYPDALLDAGYEFVRNERNWKHQVSRYTRFLSSGAAISAQVRDQIAVELSHKSEGGRHDDVDNNHQREEDGAR